ncbi:uncharacterized protein KGF55_005151 [Candida pseudojiufengensis]|uniref:uncharacterized protein n=1 Tax=Candida pseudojiufengensis TaxID=497109 RepID=UPI002224A6BB|nr:uncharacterized protein KGF55_005151 [Candida pseudojiufengensis]KAI5959919.1 hypothetical protein KGF55_005151 [Candida pseudojiufengensis]
MAVDIEHTCRICRGEGTLNQPLYHPCKCRGSIKYIHQDCLLEWLKHSNKSTEKCDICNTNYKFKIIYDPNMPKTIPINLIWSKFIQLISGTILKIISISLYIICVLIQVPIFWKFCGRIYTWAIDGNLPINNNQIFSNALYFGEFDILSYLNSNNQLSNIQIILLKLRKFFSYTYFSGVRYLIVAIIIHIALFVEREWVIRDEGYLKLLNRKIGKEPKTKLIDMLQNALDNLRRNGNEDNNENGNNDDQRNIATNLQRLDQLNRAINDLQNQGNDQMINFEENLRRAMNRGELFNAIERNDQERQQQRLQQLLQPFHAIERNEERQQQQQQQQLQQPYHQQQHVEDSDENDENNHNIDNIQINEDNLIVEEDNEQREPNLFDQIFDNQDIDNDGDIDEDEEDEDGALPNNLNNNNNNNGAIGEFLEIFGFTLNIKTPLFIMILCDSIITAYLFLIYLIPHMIGNAFVFITGFLLKLGASFIPTKTWDWILTALYTKTNYEILDFLIASIDEILIKPTFKIINNLFFEKPLQISLIERICLILIGYGIIIGFIIQIMKHLISKKKPILGTSRKAFKILFEISSTAKVFLIFAIEIFIFPVYCGLLLDFCASPLFSKNLNSNSILLTSGSEISQINYIRIGLYWSSGTIYMLVFALFVGMVRGTILRPGVLFFIRSPDDPNARLIHDALVKPLSLQLSRIYLSAKVYTAFILLGIGGVTWGLRYIVTPEHGKYNVLLPIQVDTTHSLFILIAFAALANEIQPIVTKYIRLYWKKAFEISSHKLRLSHFILGKPISHERGHIIYRNLKEQILGTSLPDYTNPVTYREAQEIFKTDPQINSCFVPDGYYVRAPDNDTVSRKFVKKLFVPVTKDDKLLKDINEEDLKSSGYETPSSEEEEMNTDDVHTIVYRPPNFKLRCYGLILMLWIFAVILILSIGLIGLLLGRPIIQVAHSLISLIQFAPNNDSSIDWKLADLSSLFLGLIIELKLLQMFDKEHQQIGNNEINERPNILQRLINIGNFNLIATSMVSFIISFGLWSIWIGTIHQISINEPLKKYYNLSFMNYDLKSWIIHLVASIWTILPILKSAYRSKNLEPNFLKQLERNGFYEVLKYSIITHLPALVVGYFNKTKLIPTLTISFIIFVIIKSLGHLIKLYKNLNEQVKIEKFVKGRAIENDNDDED